MTGCDYLLRRLNDGVWDKRLKEMYGERGSDQARDRIARLLERYQKTFRPGEEAAPVVFSAPGRTELGGNHTDHQRGHVLCGSVDLDILACAVPNGSDRIRVCSEGYPELSVDINELAPLPQEKNTSAALVRGIAAGMKGMGYPVGGFNACVTSAVPAGSGLSSSAAYEVLVGTIMNHFFCAGKLSQVEIAKVGQYAENVYFGKPSGLMDQMACSVGGIISVDFADPDVPVVRTVNCNFEHFGYALCIVDTGSCHADLTEDYGKITEEMGAVAGFFGKKYLSELTREKTCQHLSELRKQCGDRAILRALHFFDEDRRAQRQADALERGAFTEFLKLVNESGLSSQLCLQNTWSVSDPRQQAIPLALAVGRELMEGTGAIRVHGGGFAGTIQAWVPVEKLQRFCTGMQGLFGPEACYVMRIRQVGGCVVLEDNREGRT